MLFGCIPTNLLEAALMTYFPMCPRDEIEEIPLLAMVRPLSARVRLCARISLLTRRTAGAVCLAADAAAARRAVVRLHGHDVPADAHGRAAVRDLHPHQVRLSRRRSQVLA